MVKTRPGDLPTRRFAFATIEAKGEPDSGCRAGPRAPRLIQIMEPHGTSAFIKRAMRMMISMESYAQQAMLIAARESGDSAALLASAELGDLQNRIDELTFSSAHE